MIADRLRDEVISPLKQQFVGREEVIDLIALAATAGEHLFLFGPPGTAKSAVIRAFASDLQGRYFEYLLTRFSEPNELFGPIDLARLKEGVVATVTTNMLPEAEFVFLDELFNANSAILNNLLTVLNERIYRRGAEVLPLPLLSLFSASNRLPEDEALNALFDRFLLRCKVDSLPRDAMPRLLAAGWELERRSANHTGGSSVTADELRSLRRRTLDVELSGITELYTATIFRIRDLGILLSDRRAVKLLKLVAASAVLCGRDRAEGSDLWVLRYVWDREEQIAPLSAMILEVLRQQPMESAHSLAIVPEKVDPEAIAKQLDTIEKEIGKGTLAELARKREQLIRLGDQVAWIADERTRHHLLDRASKLLDRIGD